MGKVDMRFKYTPACETDIRKRFDRIRREQRKAAEVKPEPTPPANVTSMKQAKGR